jgi:hypothetical protein
LEQLCASALTASLTYFLGVAGENLIDGVTPLGSDGKILLPGTVRRLTQTTQKLKSVTIVFNAQVTGLHKTTASSQSSYRWSVQGVNSHGKAFEIEGKHVIFASGGFTANKEVLMKRGLGDLIPHFWNSINTGVVEEVAEELGFRACPEEQRQVFSVWFAEAIQLPKDNRHKLFSFSVATP